MNLPSVKTLKTISPDRAKELRMVLETTSRNELETLFGIDTKYPVTCARYLTCYNLMSLDHAIMLIADEILGTHGIEHTPRGSNAKSPAIDYCNAGDPYVTTLLYVNGNFRVGCWGDIVERGNYE